MSGQTGQAPQAEPMDTFATPQWSDTQTSTDLNSQGSELDTFGSDEVLELPNEAAAKEGDKGEEQKQAPETKDSETPEVKRETDKLEDQTPDTDEAKKAKEQSEGDGEKKEDKPDEEGEPSKEETTSEKPKGKTVRLKSGDETLDIDQDATVPVRVKGRKEFVSIKDLQANYSGQKAWSQEIEDAKIQKVEHEKVVEQFEQAREQTRQHFAKIGGMIEDAFSNPEADPLQAMKYLVELSGRSVLDFEKGVMKHYGALAEDFSLMDDSEKDLYWTRRENEILRNNQTAQAKADEERKTREDRAQQAVKVREKYGVSEEAYESAKSELEGLGYEVEKVSDEQISHYAALMPFAAEAEKISQPFSEDLSDDEMDTLVTTLTDTLYKYPKLSKEEALRFSAKQMGYELELADDDTLIDTLQDKVKEPEDRSKAPKSKYRYGKEPEPSQIESFDDFDKEIYGGY